MHVAPATLLLLQSVTLEIVKLVSKELHKRMSNASEHTEPDDNHSNLSPRQLLDQFPVVKSEIEMVNIMRERMVSGLRPFDVIITPFGCDSKSLPDSVRKLLEENESVSDPVMPARMKSLKRVSNFSTPTAPSSSASSPTVATASGHFGTALNLAASFNSIRLSDERKALERGHHMCRRVTAALQKEMLAGLDVGAEEDFACASAPVIVYSLQNHVVDVHSRRQLAFKYGAAGFATRPDELLAEFKRITESR